MQITQQKREWTQHKVKTTFKSPVKFLVLTSFWLLILITDKTLFFKYFIGILLWAI